MKTILIIDDDNQIINSLKQILQVLDFNVITAEKSSDGINLAKQVLPDLILCDITMPEMDGYEVLDALKRNSLTVNIPFIFLTAKSNRKQIREGMNLGADDYLTKPFTIHELRDTIYTRLAKKEQIETEIEEKLEELRNNISLYLPHELYTPLNGIITTAQLLENCADKLTIKQIRNMGEIISFSGHRLQKTIEKFILCSELELISSDSQEMAELRSKTEKCYTNNIVIDIAQSITNEYKRNNDLILNITDQAINIPKQYFQTVVTELIDNAFKFSEANTPVEISSNIYDSFYTISITNHGRGMTKQQIKKIGAYMQFERKKYEQQGTGLGLSIAKKIVELYGGELIIESVINEKTIVNILLPINSL